MCIKAYCEMVKVFFPPHSSFKGIPYLSLSAADEKKDFYPSILTLKVTMMF